MQSSPKYTSYEAKPLDYKPEKYVDMKNYVDSNIDPKRQVNPDLDEVKSFH